MPVLQTEWVASTPSGLQVTLRPTTVPLSVGPVSFHIEFSPQTPDAALLSLDLVSSDMPMMGVRRFLIEPHGGVLMVATDFPMAGLWNAYVNIGVGTEAAEFTFDVRANPGESAHQHGTSPRSDVAPDDGEHDPMGVMQHDETPTPTAAHPHPSTTS